MIVFKFANEISTRFEDIFFQKDRNGFRVEFCFEEIEVGLKVSKKRKKRKILNSQIVCNRLVVQKKNAPFIAKMGLPILLSDWVW